MNFQSELDGLFFEKDEANDDIKAAVERLAEIEPKVEALLADLQATAGNYADRVLVGVEFLNTNVRGWSKPEKINISDLDLSDGQQCVLGQLAVGNVLREAGFLTQSRYGLGFESAVDAIQQTQEFDSTAAGFDVDDQACVGALDTDTCRDWVEVSYDLLNHMWAAVIRRQRSKKKVEKKHLLKAVGF